MDALLLGGMSPHNKEWLREVEAALEPLFEKTLVHDYAHWASATPHIDLEHELTTTQAQIRGAGDYIIVAKSAGVVLALKGISQKVLRPKACLFAGLPLGFIHGHGHMVDVWLKSLDAPAIFVQNSHDPAGSYHEVERFLRQHMPSPRYKAVELPGDTHDYDPKGLKRLAAELVAD